MIEQMIFSECSLNSDIDVIGYCSGKYKSENGTGDLLPHIDRSILW